MAYTYNAPYGTFDPWVNYNNPKDNPTFNNTMDPYYSAQQDSQRWDLAQTGPQSETNQARVWRWTLDQLRGQGLDPGKATQQQVQQAYFNNIARLRQDYAANGFDWGRSGYSGYDKFMVQPTTTQQGGSRPATGAGTAPVVPNTPGSVSNAAPNSVPNQGPSTPVVSGANNNPGLAGTPGVNGGLSGAGADQLAQDPNLAYQYMLRQLGWDPTAPSRFGDYLKKRFSPLLQARLAASQIGDNANYLGTIGDVINSFGQGLTQQGGNFFGDQRAIAEQALGSADTSGFLNGISDQSQVEQYLNQLATLKYAGSNPMIQQSVADTLQRGQDLYDWTAFNQMNSGQSAGDAYLTWLRNNPLYNRYLGTR